MSRVLLSHCVYMLHVHHTQLTVASSNVVNGRCYCTRPEHCTTNQPIWRHIRALASKLALLLSAISFELVDG